MHGVDDELIQGFVRKPEGKRLLGRPIRRWEYNIKMDLREIGWVEWTGFIWLRTGNEILQSIKC
jgi:hypothetical protein